MKGNLKELENGLIVSVDWLSFTITSLSDVDDVIAFLGYSRMDFDNMAHGGKGYKSMIRLNGYPVSIMFDGNDDMGIHVDISGSAISEVVRSFSGTLEVNTPFGPGYEIDFNSTFLRELLSSIRKHGHITRLDLAIDDIGSRYFTTDDLVSLYFETRIVSKFRNLKNVVESELSGNKTGHTLYFGSRRSDMFLRVYDKQLEQNKKNSNSDIPSVIFPWVRWEMECKNERANSIADLILSGLGLGEITMGVLSNYMRIINLDNANRSRCTMAPVWCAFLDGISALKLYVPQMEKDIDDKKQWVKKQVMPTLVAIIMSDGGSLEFIENNMESGLVRMKKPLREMVEKCLGGDYDN